MPRVEDRAKEAEQIPLAPCPFCGSDAVLTHKRQDKPNGTDYHIHHFVICSNMKCACALRWASSPVRAVKNWNRRLIRFTAKQPDAACPNTLKS